ncbi:2091_t:CDS:2 [Funneliformis caledonium]|uniref:2091_t:CDS:1 n=1 Tax=Funneliformis caledonium TaxID=1117310 RepID=A0A9N9BPM8_9GLOM|nr:2091_t:CDS:2 [Funneliformis caledonium]
MENAQLCHLSLGYNSSNKPNLFGCDSSNCFISNTTFNEETDHLQQPNSINEIENKEPDFIPEEDHDNKKSVDSISTFWNIAILQFIQQ